MRLRYDNTVNKGIREKYPGLKIEQGGQLSVGFNILSFLAYQTAPYCKVSCYSTKVRLRYDNTVNKGIREKYPGLKIEQGGQLSVGFNILSFLAYQTAPYCKVSCYSTKVRLRYDNTVNKGIREKYPGLKIEQGGQLSVGLNILSF